MKKWKALALIGCTALVVGCKDSTGPDNNQREYELWVVDQSNSPGLTYGGTLYIYNGSDLAAGASPSSTPASLAISARDDKPTFLNLGQAVSTMCMASTGANPVRPHYLSFNPTNTHAVLSFVASGHVVIFNAQTRAPVACLRTSTGAGGARQAHAADVSPDGSYILVANQNGKLLERIDANFVTNTFGLNTAATLDLATCTTPSGAACQAASTRPDNAPILAVPGTPDLAVVTLRGGGMFAVNPRTTPMQIRAEYDMATVRQSGLAAVRAGSNMFVSSGTDAFHLYRFPLGGFTASAAPPNQPAPTALLSQQAPGRDGHGLAASPDGRFIWGADRGNNVLEVFDAAGGTRVSTLNLVGSLSNDPAPDLLDFSPNGELLFVSMKGPNPLSGGALGTGSTPGFGVVRVNSDGRGGTLRSVVRITNLDSGGVERADVHALRVRVR